jgi:phosphate:Na+ symporter
MQHLLNLFSGIALLVWGTNLVRTGILRVFGARLRGAIEHSVSNRFLAMLAGLGVTSLVQSSTATGLIVSSFVGQGLLATAPGLAVMLGADIGTSLMSLVFSLNLQWLSPLLILVGVIIFISRQGTNVGRLGRVLIGLGLIILALQLIVSATRPWVQAEGVKVLFSTLTGDTLLDIVLGALFTMACYSSLATVLLTATLASTGVLSIKVALGLVLGANLGSGLLGFITTAKATPLARRVPTGNLIFKLVGVTLAIPLVDFLPPLLAQWDSNAQHATVNFHLLFNIVLGLGFIAFIHPVANLVERLLPVPANHAGTQRISHLDAVALSTPSVAISCAAREALHQADVVEHMLTGMLDVIRHNDADKAIRLRAMDDEVDTLYSAIKFYLTQISREALADKESRRWTDIISFTINMEQIGDIVERVLLDVEDKKIRRGLNFSEAGMAEICDMHARLVGNLRLAMSVFLNNDLAQAKSLLEEKARFRELERSYANSHLARLADNTQPSISTSSLHIDLISDLKRINSHICSVAYPILDAAGVLTQTRLRVNQEESQSQLFGDGS